MILQFSLPYSKNILLVCHFRGNKKKKKKVLVNPSEFFPLKNIFVFSQGLLSFQFLYIFTNSITQKFTIFDQCVTIGQEAPRSALRNHKEKKRKPGIQRKQRLKGIWIRFVLNPPLFTWTFEMYVNELLFWRSRKVTD